VQVDAEATRGTGWEARAVRGGGEAGAPRPPPPAPPPSPRAPTLPALLVPTDVPSVLAVGARRSSGQGGDRPRCTRTVTDALAARLVVHRCTRGSKCRARRELLLRKVRTRRQCCAAHSEGGQARSARQRTCCATHCEFAFLPTQPTDWVWCYRPSSNVRRRTRCVYSPCASVCPVVPVLAPQYVDIGPSTHRMDAAARVGLFRSNPISANAPQALRHCWGKSLFPVCVWGGGGYVGVTAAPHPSRCNSLHGTDRASSATRRSMNVVRCMLHVACCLPVVACCMLHADSCCHLACTLWKQSCTHAHTSKTSRFGAISGAQEAVG
jgi:hypothetical protein